MRCFPNIQLSAAVCFIFLVWLGATATAAAADAVLLKAGEARVAAVGDIVRLP